MKPSQEAVRLIESGKTVVTGNSLASLTTRVSCIEKMIDKKKGRGERTGEAGGGRGRV